jgi:hypothetical protein
MIVHRLQRWTENIFPASLRLMVSRRLTTAIQHLFIFGTLRTTGVDFFYLASALPAGRQAPATKEKG